MDSEGDGSLAVPGFRPLQKVLRSGSSGEPTAQDGGAILDTKSVVGRLTFERVYDERFGDVQRWIRALGCRPPDVADLAQDVFLIAFRRLAAFDGQNLAGWLYQIAKRKMRDYRRLSWIKHLFTNQHESAFDNVAIGGDQLEQVDQGRRQLLLERILRELPADQRAAFVLFELDGLTGAQIAEIQRVPLNTVWARLHRARHRLQRRALALQQPTHAP